MPETSGELESPKEALKQLQAARKEQIAAAAARMREQKKFIKAIKEELGAGGKTVPEIAAATGIAPDAVLWYLATLKKYGQVTEGAKDGSYFRYKLAANNDAEA